jgi:hypothetical protein
MSVLNGYLGPVDDVRGALRGGSGLYTNTQ